MNPGKACPECRRGLPRDVDGFHRVGRHKVLCTDRPVARPPSENSNPVPQEGGSS